MRFNDYLIGSALAVLIFAATTALGNILGIWLITALVGLGALLGLRIVHQDERLIVERFGAFQRILDPGLRWVIPVVDQVRFKISTREQVLELEIQKTFTKDDIPITIISTLYYRLIPSFRGFEEDTVRRAAYGVEIDPDHPEKAIEQLAISTLRSISGQERFDDIVNKQDEINNLVREAMNPATVLWGYEATRHQIKEIIPPPEISNALLKELTAAKDKIATVTASEAEREAQINRAEGEKQAIIKKAEAQKFAEVALAEAKREVQRLDAEGEALGIKLRAEQLATPEGRAAAEYNLHEQRLTALGRLAKISNTVIVTPQFDEAAGLGIAVKKMFEATTSMPPQQPKEAA